LIAIDNTLVSDDVIEAKFVCDLHKCKGGCCEDGDAGAPVEKEEMRIIEENFKAIEPYLTPEGLKEIKTQGKFLYDREFGWVTPTINNAVCAYGFRDKQGIIKCGIEAAYNDGKLNWKKPISCHLFPIKISRTKDYTMVNYEPREGLCNPGCALGKKVKMPVYEFLRESLIRKFGETFYNTLHQIALDYFEAKQSVKRK
jgi:hypothetical protein